MVTRFANGKDGCHLRRLTRAHFNCADTAFEGCNTLLEHACGWVGDARVNVPRLLQREQTRRALRALQVIRAGLIDRHRTAARCCFRVITCMQLPRGKTKFAFCFRHKTLLEFNMSLRGALGFCRSSLLLTGDCFVGKGKNPPRNDILKMVVYPLFRRDFIIPFRGKKLTSSASTRRGTYDTILSSSSA